MKQVLAILLLFVMLFSLSACGSFADKNGQGSNQAPSSNTDSAQNGTPLSTQPSAQNSDSLPESAETSEERLIAAFVEVHKEEIISDKENYFVTSAGYTCESDIVVSGRGFVITLKINELENLTSEKKNALQLAYDEMYQDTVDMLDDYKAALPELEYFKVNICDRHGDILAVVKAGKI